jgi:hypothetical protein
MPSTQQRGLLIAFSLLVALLAMSGAAQEEGPSREGQDYWFINPKNLSAELLVLKGAHDMQVHQQSDGSTWVSYSLEAKYPATNILVLIDQHLRDRGFEPLRNDWLNPEIPSSYTRGWSNYEDGTSDPPQNVHQWLTHWKNELNAVVLVDLRYRSPVPTNQDDFQGPASDEVRITMALLPPELAERLFRLATENHE